MQMFNFVTLVVKNSNVYFLSFCENVASIHYSCTLLFFSIIISIEPVSNSMNLSLFRFMFFLLHFITFDFHNLPVLSSPRRYFTCRYMHIHLQDHRYNTFKRLTNLSEAVHVGERSTQKLLEWCPYAEKRQRQQHQQRRE